MGRQRATLSVTDLEPLELAVDVAYAANRAGT